MNIAIASIIALGLGVGGTALYLQMQDVSAPDANYTRSDIYAQCDVDYLQSARHLGFKASKTDCECFDQKLQKLTPSQRRAAYKSLEDQLTLAFMGKAGATVNGTNVTYNDDLLGEVGANVQIETSGKAIIQQCDMF